MEQNLWLLLGLSGAIIFFFGFMAGKEYAVWDEDENKINKR